MSPLVAQAPAGVAPTMALLAPKAPDILMVGSGPVGLWTAIHAKIQNPALQILMFERYETYTRNNTLNIAVKSLSGASQDPRLQAILRKWREKAKGSMIRIPTLHIQQGLAKLARELGIEIQTRTVADAKALAEEFPAARCIVGTDGSHSVVQEQFFEGKMWLDEVVNYTVLLKYKIKKQSDAHDFVSSYQASKMAGTFFDENISSQENEDGSFNVTLQIFLDEPSISAISGYSFKNPAKLSDLRVAPSESKELTETEKIKEEIVRKIMIWIASKRIIRSEEMVKDSDRLSAVPLRSYCSKAWVKVHETKDARQVAVAIVGDSAMGVPFFRSLNNGLISGVWLAHDLAQIKAMGASQGSSLPVEPFPSFAGYKRRMTFLAIRELLFAKIKSIVIRSLQMFLAISSKFFMKISIWKQERREYILEASKRSVADLVDKPMPVPHSTHYAAFS